MKSVGRFRNKEFGYYITLTGLLFSFAIYANFSTFSIRGLFGFLILNFFFFLYLDNSFFFITKISINKIQGLMMVSIASLYLLLQFFNKNVFGTVVFISIFCGVELLILLWILLGKVKSNRIKILIALVVFGLLTFLLYFWQNFGKFTPDSYSFYEISETFGFGKEYGKANTIRQYTIISDYNISYPYFFPLCIHIIDSICLLGRYSSILLNFYSCLLTIVFLFKISKTVINKLWCGCLPSFVLLINESYLGEICAGNSIPLSVFLFVLILYLLLNLNNKSSKYILVGLLAGAILNTRFDNILFIFFVPIIVLIVSKNKIKNILLYFLGFLITTAPWVYYSEKHFNRVWISDNVGTAFLVKTEMPIHIFLPNEEIKTLFNFPLEWFCSLISKTISVLDALCSSYIADIVIIILFVMVIRKVIDNRKEDKFSFALLLITLFYYCGKTGVYLLSGFHDARYHVETVTILTLVLSILFVKAKCKVNIKIIGLLSSIFFFICLYCFSGQYYGTLFKGNTNEFQKIEVEPSWIQSIDKQLDEYINDRKDSIVFVGGESYEFGGWTRRNIWTLSDSVNIERLEYLLKNISHSHYVLINSNYENTNILEHLDNSYDSISVDDYCLYVVNN